jgi:hypothetical protein
MLYSVALVRTYVSEERMASIFRVTGIGELYFFAVYFVCYLLIKFLARGFFYPEIGGGKFLRNVGSYKSYTT